MSASAVVPKSHITPKDSLIAYCGKDFAGVPNDVVGKADDREQERDDCAECWRLWREAGCP